MPGGGQVGPRRDASRAAAMLDGQPDGQGGNGGYRGRHSQAAGTTDPRRPAGGPGLAGAPAPGPGIGADGGRADGSRGMGGRADGGRPDDSRGIGGDGAGLYRPDEPPVARRTATGWRVGDEEVSDLTSAMVLADLLAADLPPEGPPTPGGPAVSVPPGRPAPAAPDIRQLQETVAQLEHALTVRVRVEQAIGVLAERHRMRPRLAFELLRSAARARGRRVLEVAGEVVDSATNPLLRLPEELAKPPVARRRGRMPRRPQESD